MNFLNRFVERPVLASVVALVVLLLGLQSIGRLQVRQYPETIFTTITITTPYIGANAELVRGFITTPLEQAIATADGIEYLESASSQGQSVITARLLLGFDPNEAVAQILTKINQVANRLPPEAENPILFVSTGEETAAMFIAFYSEILATSQITDYLTRAVRPRLESVIGVQEAQILGGQPVAMRVWLDPRRMAALGVTPSEVRAALANQNFLAAAGQTKGPVLSMPLEIESGLKDVDAFRGLVIREDGGTLIRLSDVGEVTLGAENYSSSVFFNGRPVVFVGIEVTPEANLLETMRKVRELLPAVQDQLPGGLDGLIVYDATVAIENSIDEVVTALIEALVIVTFIIFLFLGALRSALVPAVAMPIALVGAFFLMHMMGFSINLLTLLALILAIGTVVDDGIIIVENATRHIEAGANPEEAAQRTVNELAGSIVAMNIVVLAVFAPIGLMGGLTGALFTEFAYTVAGATLISGIIALTLSPMMCARLLKPGTTKRRITRWVDDGFRRVSGAYARALSAALNVRWIVLGAGAVILVGAGFLYVVAERELAPTEDQGFLIVIAQGDPNGSIDQLERWTEQLVDSLHSMPAVEHVFAVNGGGPSGLSSNSAFGGIVLQDWEDREATQPELAGQLQGAVARIAGLQAVVISPPSLPGSGGGAPVQFVISSIEDPRAVLETSQAVLQAARQSGLFIFVESDLKFDQAQTRIKIDRDRAAALGIDVSQLGADLATMLSGGYVNFFSFDGRSYRVVPQVERPSRLRAAQILNYYTAVRDPDGDPDASGQRFVPLSAVVDLEETIEPRQLLRFNQLNSAVLTGVPAPGVSLGQAVEFFEAQAELLPAGYVTDWLGRSRQYVTESSALILSFGLAIVFMYLTLAAQYESYRDPAIMFLSVPMALAGALFFFAIGVVTVNIYTQIGLLALIGSIIRHGILLVEFANDMQRDEGLDRRAAMEKAAAIRLRAILMTTIATVIGLVPLLLAASGPGAESRFAISFTLATGMGIGTLFTLFVVPALYTVVATERTPAADPSTPSDRALPPPHPSDRDAPRLS